MSRKGWGANHHPVSGPQWLRAPLRPGAPDGLIFVAIIIAATAVEEHPGYQANP
jgi:hypothetical protein